LERKHRLSFSLTEVVQLLLCNRWSNPWSKLGIYETQDDYIGFSSMKLHHLYRTLDKLSSASTALQEHLYKCNTKLIDYQIDVVFYDVTTFYFESEVVQEKALRQIGFGKDGKVGNTQILLGLLLDKQRNPRLRTIQR
jgi:glycosidase